MTASIQGSVQVNTDSIKIAIDRINALNKKLRTIDQATKAFEKAAASANKPMQDQSRLVQRNANLINRAAKTVQDYNAKIDLNVRGSQKQNQLLEQVGSAFERYSRAVVAAEGDALDLQTAKVSLDAAIGRVNRSLQAETKLTQAQAAAESQIAKEAQKSADVLSKNSVAIQKASDKLANYEQKINKSNLSEQEKQQLITKLNSSFSQYTSEIESAAGKTTKVSQANANYSSSLSEINRGLASYSKVTKTTEAQEVSKVNKLAELERQYQRYVQVIKNSNLTLSAQREEEVKLKSALDLAKVAVRANGAATVDSAKKINDFRDAVQNTSRTLRSQLKGVGRGAGQAGIQIQQFVGQIQGGVDPMIALSQQSADLGFALGVPLAGAIAGIAFSLGSALVPTLFNGKDAVEEFAEAIDNLRESSIKTDGSLITLSDEIMNLAKINIDLARVQAGLNLTEAEKGVKKAVGAISDELGALADFTDAKLVKRIASARKNIVSNVDQASIAFEEFGEKFGLAGAPARDFGKTVAEAYSELEKDPSAEGITTFTSTIGGLRDQYGNLNKEGEEFLRKILSLTNKAKDASDVMKVLKEAVGATSEELKSMAFESSTQQVIKENQALLYELEGNAKAANELRFALSKGVNSFDELPEDLRNAYLAQVRLNEALEKMSDSAKSNEALSSSLKKLQQNYAVLQLQAKGNAEEAFMLAEAHKLGKDSVSELDAEQTKMLATMFKYKQDIKDANKSLTDLKNQQKLYADAITAVNEAQAKTTIYTNSSTQAQVDAKLAALANTTAMNKQLNSLKLLSDADKQRLANSLGVTTNIKNRVQFEKDLAKAYKDQVTAATDAQKAAQSLFNARQQMQNITASSSNIAGINQNFDNQRTQLSQDVGATLGGITDPQKKKELVDQYVASMMELDKQKEAALAAARMQGQQASQIGPISNTEQLRQDFEQRKQTLKDIFGEESQMYKDHLADLENQYKQQNFQMEFANQAQAANDVLGGAMNVMQTMGKENSKAYQAMAIGQAVIQQAMAVNSVWADPSVPFWGKIGLSAMAGAQVGAQIKAIKSQSFATGGYVSGAGTGTSDSIPARLSDGEYVINAAATRLLGVDTLDMLNKGKLPIGLKMGGSVGRVPTVRNESGGNSWGDISVQVINEGNGQVEATRTEQGYAENGKAELRIFIREVMQEEFNAGRTDRTMNSNYGLTRKPTRR